MVQCCECNDLKEWCREIFSEYVFAVFISGVEREWKCSGENGQVIGRQIEWLGLFMRFVCPLRYTLGVIIIIIIINCNWVVAWWHWLFHM